jgi:hypothetical protein
MSESVSPSGTVHWLGTGLSTGSGLRVLAERAHRVVLWGRTEERALGCAARLGLTDRVEVRAHDGAAVAGLGAVVEPGDVVVSMLPASEHGALLRLCVEHGAHFACSSYTSDAVTAEAPAAERTGVVVLTEAGLDPGIDHLFADLLVHGARAALGDGPAAVEFTSYCGGIPAEPNEFRYRFSWAPRGVLTALCSPARFVDAGTATVVDHPWEATRPHVLDGETFEVYPNRDSLPFIAQYGLPSAWRAETFVRGTLRPAGWREAWSGVFAELLAGDDERVTALAADLAARYPTTDADRDRVVLAVALRVRSDEGGSWSGQYLLDAVGDDDESAMARCVSLPLAFGVTEILTGKLPAGLRRAAEGAADAQRWLDFLALNGVPHSVRQGITSKYELR